MSGTIKRCPQCGAACIYTDVFCVVCGHQLEDVAEKKVEPSAFILPKEARGDAQESPPPSVQGARAPAHERHKARMAAGAGKKRRQPAARAFIVAVAAILVIGLYFGVSQKGGAQLFPGKTEASSETPQMQQGIPGPMPAPRLPVEPLTEPPDGFIPLMSADDLMAINDDLTGNYILMNDINLGGGPGKEWVPIGAAAGAVYTSLADYGGFTGVFEGNGYTISGLYVAASELTQSQVAAMGLFAMVLEGTVRNLCVQGEIVLAGRSSSYTYAGGIAGVQMGTARQAAIQNCAFTGRVSGAVYTGGIVGMQMSRHMDAPVMISHCANAGAISGKMAGGIVGCQVASSPYAAASVQYCANVGQVGTADGANDEAGGIVGIVQASSTGALAELFACSNTRDIFGKSYTGGIAGRAVVASGGAGNARISIDSCYNTAPVTGKRMAGGITGCTFVESAVDEILLTRCYNTGRIKGALRMRAAITPKGGSKEEKAMQVVDCYYTRTSGCRDPHARRTDKAGIGSALAGKGAYQPGGEPLPVLRTPHLEQE